MSASRLVMLTKRGTETSFDLQARVVAHQLRQARSEEDAAEAFGDADADLPQRRDALAHFFLGEQRGVLHRLGVLEQRLAGRSQLVAAGVLGEQLGAEVALDVLDVPGHRGVSGAETLGGGQQATAALQLEEETQVIPVEHGESLLPGRGGGLLENEQ